MTKQDAIIVVAWILIGLPLAAWAAAYTAKDYNPEKLEASPGLTALMVVLFAPIVAFFVAVYFIQKPITRWAMRRAGRS